VTRNFRCKGARLHNTAEHAVGGKRGAAPRDSHGGAESGQFNPFRPASAALAATGPGTGVLTDLVSFRISSAEIGG
jgi:hypothetical protein